MTDRFVWLVTRGWEYEHSYSWMGRDQSEVLAVYDNEKSAIEHVEYEIKEENGSFVKSSRGDYYHEWKENGKDKNYRYFECMRRKVENSHKKF